MISEPDETGNPDAFASDTPPPVANKFDVLFHYFEQGEVLSWKEIVEWSNQNEYGKFSLVFKL